MVTIRRQHGVIAGQRGLCANGHGLLAIVQVAESADELLLVELQQGDKEQKNGKETFRTIA